MSLQTQAVIAPHRDIDGNVRGRFRLQQAGDFIETDQGWGRITRVDAGRGQVTVELFKGRPWIERQHCPEYEMKVKFDRVAEQHRKRGALWPDPDAPHKLDAPVPGYELR